MTETKQYKTSEAQLRAVKRYNELHKEEIAEKKRDYYRRYNLKRAELMKNNPELREKRNQYMRELAKQRRLKSVGVPRDAPELDLFSLVLEHSMMASGR